MSRPKHSSNNNVKLMMDHIQLLYLNDDPILKGVNNVNLLYDALCDLNDVIGMTDIKDSIIKLIKFLLVTYENNKDSKFDDHMLHTIIMGPPGVGKTSVGSVLAKIWASLGLVKKIKITKGSLLERKKGEHDVRTEKALTIIPIPIYLHDKNIDYTYSESTSDNIIKERSNKNKESCNKETQTSSNYTNVSNLTPESTSFLRRPNRRLISTIRVRSKETTQTDEEDDYDNNKSNENVDNKEYPINMGIHDNDHKMIDEASIILTNPIVYSHKSINFEGSTLLYTMQRANVMSELINLKKKIRLDIVTTHILNDYSARFKNNVFRKPLCRMKQDAPIKIVSRPDFVGMYIGHTADKTMTLLSSTLEDGKVLFIDEAYSLILDDRDSFGNEALNELNRFMSEHPELVIIMAGYKDKMEATLFKHQPGLKRRCTWFFEISNYQPEMLSDIFNQQLNKDKWSYDGSNKELTKFFSDKMNKFKAFGGDTLRLVLYCKLKYSELVFDGNNSDISQKTINKKILQLAYDEIYLKSSETLAEDDETYKTMFI